MGPEIRETLSPDENACHGIHGGGGRWAVGASPLIGPKPPASRAALSCVLSPLGALPERDAQLLGLAVAQDDGVHGPTRARLREDAL